MLHIEKISDGCNRIRLTHLKMSHMEEVTVMDEHHPPKVIGEVVNIFVQIQKDLTFGLEFDSISC